MWRGSVARRGPLGRFGNAELPILALDVAARVELIHVAVKAESPPSPLRTATA